MNHDVIVAEIQARAKRRGVLSHYCHRSVTCDGDRGMPDLLLVGHFGVAFVEVKTMGDTLKPDQTTWRHALLAAGQEYHIIMERGLHDGDLTRLLDHLSQGAAVA